MKLFTTAIVFLTAISSLFAQFEQRSTKSLAEAPFFHGVASGDPLSESVMLWTRVTPEDGSGNDVDVYWQVATDTSFTNVINFGKATAIASQDFTVKLDVCGLNPESYYYYVFQAYGKNSVIGRTKTAPTGGTDEVRFGVASCSSYEHGYFNAYESMSKRNDLDAIIHLGDYIYEYETGGFSSTVMTDQGRVYEPGNEAITLTDYRARHSHYKLDDQLQLLHQVHPFITTWDDHETANDAYKDGAENHDAGTEGLWQDRKVGGTQAYSEWMPIRNPDPNDPLKIWRKLRYGELLDLIVLDSRLWGRDEQDMGSTDDTNHKMLGDDQFDWLENQLIDNITQWKIITQQVMLAPLEIFGNAVNADQWDGYNADRQRLISFIENNNIGNPVVLTGDIHSTFINNVEGNNGIAASEFVVTSVTSPGIDVIETALGNLPQWLLDAVGGTVNGALESFNDHMQYVNMEDHGYMVLTVNDGQAQGDYVWLDREVLDDTDDFATSWYVNDGTAGMNEATAHIAPITGGAILPPSAPVQTIPFAIIPDTIFATGITSQIANDCIVHAVASCPNLDVTIPNQPTLGSASINDFCFNYQAPINYIGEDNFEIILCQTINPSVCDTVVVMMNVTGDITVDTLNYTVENVDTLTDCLTFDDLYTDVENYSVLFTGFGNVTIDNSGCFEYSSIPNACGLENVTIVACDSVGVCDTTVLQIEVTGNSAIEYITIQGEAGTLINDCFAFDDLAGNTISTTLEFNANNGEALLYDNDTCFSYTANDGFSGIDTIMIIACDDFNPQKCDTIIYLIDIPTSINDIENDIFAIMGVYPNPFDTEILIQYYQFKDEMLSLKLYNINGSLLFNENILEQNTGLQYARIGTEDLPAGEYLLEISSGTHQYVKKVIKY